MDALEQCPCGSCCQHEARADCSAHHCTGYSCWKHFDEWAEVEVPADWTEKHVWIGD